METEEYGIVLALVAVVVIILVFALVFFFQVYKSSILKIEKEKQVAAFRAAVEAEEKQRAKTANDLHDEILHLITVTKQQVNKDKIDRKAIADLLDQTSAGVRSIALDLLPKTLVSFGLISAIEQHAILLNANANKKIDIENHTPYQSDLPFGKNDEVNIYRICLEILNNLMKHTKFSYLHISFQDSENLFIIEFSHDGAGISNKEIEKLSQTTAGLGLKSLHTRLLILKAEINYFVGENLSSIVIEIPHTK